MFLDRRDAGLRLAESLGHYRGDPDVVVLALPRGGVVTGYEIARTLIAPLDVLLVRKIGVPWNPEVAAGAVSETGTIVINREIVRSAGITGEFIQDETVRQQQEIDRRIELYRHGRGITALKDRTIILVDDGVATGATMKAAIAALKKENLGRLVVALPVAPPETAHNLEIMVDEFVCLLLPDDFASVGNYYRDFAQVTDDEVVALLRESETLMKKRPVRYPDSASGNIYTFPD